MLKKDVSHKIIFWGILATFAIIYSLISLVNHYYLRTNALDLGMFNHAIYNFSRFEANTFTLSVHGNELNYFGDHFSPITALLSPLYYLFGSYTLLIVQIGAILLGGVGIYRIADYKLENKGLSLLILIHFFSVWAITSALSFDFHTNVTGAMLVPWLVYFWMQNKFTNTFLTIILIWICKENMALWTTFIGLGFWIGGKVLNPNKNWKFDAILFLSSFLYFILVMKIIMPAFQGNSEITQLAKYGYMGNSIGEIIAYLFKHPSYIITCLYDGTWGSEDFTAIKLETHLMIFVSGGILLLFKPQLLVMLLPIYYQKFLAADNMVWSMGIHYNIEFVPIISIALILFLNRLKSKSLKYGVTGLILTSTLFFTVSKLNARSVPYHEFQKPKESIFMKEHYQSPYNIEEVKKVISDLPQEINVCTNSIFAPRLERRDKIYFFPYVKDAYYVILDKHQHGHYPLSDENFAIKHEEFKKRTDFQLIKETKDLWLYKRILNDIQ